MRLSVLIPVRNEEGSLRRTIEPIVAALSDAGIEHEIIVVDDHSTDGTSDIVEWLSSKMPALRGVANARPRGFGNAVRAGLEAYTGDAVCIVRPNAPGSPQEIVDYARKLADGNDCAFGSRERKSMPAHIANQILRALFDLGYDDVTDTFKCYRREVIDDVRPILSQHLAVALELPLKAILRGHSYAVSSIARHEAAEGVKPARHPRGGVVLLLLYLWIEKLLTGGERRGMEAGAPAAGPSMLLPWAAFATVALVHLLWVLTYPLNYLGGDAPSYYWLMMYRRSNLAVAPGYPFLVGLPITFHSVMRFCFDHEPTFRSILLVVQHLIDLCCLGVFMLVIARVYSRSTAVVAVLLAGVSLQGMAVTSATYPEWLQGDLLMLAISFALLAWRAETFGRKAFCYALAWGAFTWCYLVKYNAAVFFPLLLIAIGLEKLRWTKRLQLLAAAAGFAFVNYAAFLVFFHKPKTETYTLSYDHSWVLMARLNQAYSGKLPYPQGIATKRWLALAGVLPKRYDLGSIGPFDGLHPMYVSKEDRAKYRNVSHLILDTKDEALLDRIIREHPLPPNFALNNSSIPVSWYVGLKESDDVGVKVFWESVLHHPGPYLVSTARNLREALRSSTAEVMFATQDNVKIYAQKVIPFGSYFRLEQTAATYRYGDALVWRPGFVLFSQFASLSGKSHRLLVGLVLLGFFASIVLGFLAAWSHRVVVAALLTFMLGLFMLVSCAVLEFRWKEMRFVLPLVSMLIGVFAGWTLPELMRAGSRLVARARECRRPTPAAAPEA